MNEFHSETLTPETLERLDHLKKLSYRSIDLFLEESEAVLELSSRPDVKKSGGIGRVVSGVLGFSKGYTSKRLLVGEKLIAPLTLERVQAAGFLSQEVLYQAARAVDLNKMDAAEAVEAFPALTREAAVLMNKDEDELIPIPGLYPASVVKIFMEGIMAAETKGFTRSVMLERLGVFMRESDKETLEQYVFLMELNA